MEFWNAGVMSLDDRNCNMLQNLVDMGGSQFRILGEFWEGLVCGQNGSWRFPESLIITRRDSSGMPE